MLRASDLKPLSQRSVKCDWCGMRGSSGSGANLYWFQDATGGKHLLHGNSSGPSKYGLAHITVCKGSSAIRYRERRNISHGLTFDELQAHLGGYEPTNRVSEPETVEPELQTSEQLVAPTLDLEELERVVDKAVDKALSEREPTYVQVSINEFEQIELPHQVHYQFEEVWCWVEMTVPVWLTGPAGTGKSTIMRHIAEAMGIEYRFISMTANTQLSEITGFMSAHGEYVRTPFRDAFEFGYVFCIDEADRANPNTLLKLNEALASREFAFPDGVVKAHEKFRAGATANTFGLGADSQYVGGLQIDAASLDRFAIVPVAVDEALETSVSMSMAGDKASEFKVWLENIRALRRAAETMRLKVVISPRASYFTAQAVRQGKLSEAQILRSAIRKGISDADWDRLCDSAGVTF